MAVLCSTIAPTEELISYLLAHFGAAGNNKNFKELPIISDRLLRKTVVMKHRENSPTNMEICAILV